MREEQAAGATVEQILQGHSRSRKQPPAQTHPAVVEQILSMRDQPPEGLRRVPGQEAIEYSLQRDPMLQFFPLPVPSCKTIYRILKKHDRIPHHSQPPKQPMERPAPMIAWQIDFKDEGLVRADATDLLGKRQHVVETLNIIDVGTCVLLDVHVRTDFTAETALEALALTLAKYGCPKLIPLDRDPLLSSAVQQAVTFRPPSCALAPAWASRSRSVSRITLSRTALSSGTTAPIKKSALPGIGRLDLEQAKVATEVFVQHYTVERPHQGLSCANRPPRTAFPTLPPLAALPSTVDPDSWLSSLDGLHLERKVDRNGMVSVDLKRDSRLSSAGGPSCELAVGCRGALRARLSRRTSPQIVAAARTGGPLTLL